MLWPSRLKEAQGPFVTSMFGYTLGYNALDNNKNPTSGLFAGPLELALNADDFPSSFCEKLTSAVIWSPGESRSRSFGSAIG